MSYAYLWSHFFFFFFLQGTYLGFLLSYIFIVEGVELQSVEF